METTTRELMRRLEAAEQRSVAAARKARGMTLAALVLMVGLLALSLPPMAAQAQKGGGGGGSSLESRVAALESENATQATQITTLQSENAALKAKTAPLSLSGDDFIISGKNVHIVNGTGRPHNVNGLGNLTIGYNHSRVAAVGGTDLRTGSHNLVLGDANNYSSYGGLVVGNWNTISSPYASVSGGVGNTASGGSSSVSGGYGNTASGLSTSVSGGYGNTASGFYASVAGGYGNVANGNCASVAGGETNTASGLRASVSGGANRSAPGNFNWAAGSLFESQ